jgi:acetyl-CoA synthetase
MTTFQEARAFLLKHRADYDAAVKGFSWPDPVPFNWALDWFDAELAQNPDSRDRTALWIVDPGDKETKLRKQSSPSPRCRAAPTRSRTSCVRKG